MKEYLNKIDNNKINTYDTKEIEERVIIVAVAKDKDNKNEVEESIKELESLVKTVNAKVVGKVIQNREKVHNATYVGKGKVEEIAILISSTNATGIVCDDELSPSQLKNLEMELNTKVMDRTLIILDIFAKRATTSEGKIQVELAQLKYRMARLIGLRSSLSRLGGGIGTKGPGEKKLEMDKRLINDRVVWLKREITDMQSHRELARKQRNKGGVSVVSIVGYTNAGKSTLINMLTDAKVLEEDKLFATLDPTTRAYKLPNGEEILITDTVGFIRKLPHNLIDAFRSTLEEAKYADIIIHVVDASNPQMNSQMKIVYETLDGLEVKDKTIITMFNKQDLIIGDKPILRDERADFVINTAIKKREGLEELATVLTEILRNQKEYIEKIIPYNEANKVQILRKKGQLLEEDYLEEGIKIKGYINKQFKNEI